MATDQDFWLAYERLSAIGQCDNPGGAEYRRSIANWKLHDCPSDLDQFITSHANTRIDAEGPELYQSHP
jgi:hypothetical protein